MGKCVTFNIFMKWSDKPCCIVKNVSKNDQNVVDVIDVKREGLNSGFTSIWLVYILSKFSTWRT